MLRFNGKRLPCALKLIFQSLSRCGALCFAIFQISAINFVIFRLKKGKELEASDRIKMEKEGTTYTLLIENVKQSDQGFYGCKISNSDGDSKCSSELLVEGMYPAPSLLP